LDTQKLRELLDQRDAIDEEIVAVVGGKKPERKAVTCSHCKLEGHTLRNCPTKSL